MDQETYRQKWAAILSDYDKELQKEMNEKNKNFKLKDPIQPGDLVLIENKTAHKEDLKYYRNIYEVAKILEAKYICTPLFKGQRVMAVKGDSLKPYSHSHLFELLPPNIRELMGESMTPDELKRQSHLNPQDIPKDFQDWPLLQLPKPMRLRQRISPPSLSSEPAVTVPNTNTVSHLTSDSDLSSSGFAFSLKSMDGVITHGVPPQPRYQTDSILSCGSLGSFLGPPRLLNTSLVPNKTAPQVGVPGLKATGTQIIQAPRTIIPLMPPVLRPVYRPRKIQTQNPPGKLKIKRVPKTSTPIGSSEGSIQVMVIPPKSAQKIPEAAKQDQPPLPQPQHLPDQVQGLPPSMSSGSQPSNVHTPLDRSPVPSLRASPPVSPVPSIKSETDESGLSIDVVPYVPETQHNKPAPKAKQPTSQQKQSTSGTESADDYQAKDDSGAEKENFEQKSSSSSPDLKTTLDLGSSVSSSDTEFATPVGQQPGRPSHQPSSSDFFSDDEPDFQTKESSKQKDELVNTEPSQTPLPDMNEGLTSSSNSDQDSVYETPENSPEQLIDLQDHGTQVSLNSTLEDENTPEEPKPSKQPIKGNLPKALQRLQQNLKQRSLLNDQQDSSPRFSRAGRPLRIPAKLRDYVLESQPSKTSQSSKSSDTVQQTLLIDETFSHSVPLLNDTTAENPRPSNSVKGHPTTPPVKTFYQDDNMGLPSPPSKDPSLSSDSISSEIGQNEPPTHSKDQINPMSPQQNIHSSSPLPDLAQRPFTPNVLIIEHDSTSGKTPKSILKSSPQGKQHEEKQLNETIISDKQIQNTSPIDMTIQPRKQKLASQGKDEIQDISLASPENVHQTQPLPQVLQNKENDKIIKMDKQHSKERAEQQPPMLRSLSNRRPASFFTNVKPKTRSLPPVAGITPLGQKSSDQKSVQSQSFLSERIPTIDLSQYINPYRDYNPLPTQQRPLPSFPPWQSLSPPKVNRVTNLDIQNDIAKYHPAVRPIRNYLDPSLMDTFLPPMGSLRNVPLSPLTPSPKKSDQVFTSPASDYSDTDKNLPQPLFSQEADVNLNKGDLEKDKTPDSSLQTPNVSVEQSAGPTDDDWKRTKPVKRPEPPSPGLPSMSHKREQMIIPKIKRIHVQQSPDLKNQSSQNQTPSSPIQQIETPEQTQGVGQNTMHSPVRQSDMDNMDIPEQNVASTKRPHPATPLRKENLQNQAYLATPQAPSPKRQIIESDIQNPDQSHQTDDVHNQVSQQQQKGSRHSSRQSNQPSRLQYVPGFVQTSTQRNKKSTQPIPSTGADAKQTSDNHANQSNQPVQEQVVPEQPRRSQRQRKEPNRYGFD
jgi:hypothetical protein